MARALAIIIILLLLVTSPVLAADVSVGLERLQDEVRYHFDNDSTWDTPYFVPHFFEQTYSAGKNLFVVRVRGERWDFEAGVTPVHTADGSDYDTFFQTNGDVVVHGTSTPVSARSWRASYNYNFAGQWILGYAFAHDQMTFPDSISTTTHTLPPSLATNLSTTRESVHSDILDIRIGYRRTRAISAAWEIGGEAAIAPVTAALLTTYLPDKYDKPVEFTAWSYSLAAAAHATWRAGNTSVTLAARAGASRPFQERRSLEREQNAISLAIGYRLR